MLTNNLKQTNNKPIQKYNPLGGGMASLKAEVLDGVLQ